METALLHTLLVALLQFNPAPSVTINGAAYHETRLPDAENVAMRLATRCSDFVG